MVPPGWYMLYDTDGVLSDRGEAGWIRRHSGG